MPTLYSTLYSEEGVETSVALSHLLLAEQSRPNGVTIIGYSDMPARSWAKQSTHTHTHAIP